jgi:hypothetical protein
MFGQQFVDERRDPTAWQSGVAEGDEPLLRTRGNHVEFSGYWQSPTRRLIWR